MGREKKISINLRQLCIFVYVSDRGCADPKVGSTVKDFNKTTCFGLCQVAATHPFPYPPKSEQKDTGVRSFAPDKRLFFEC